MYDELTEVDIRKMQEEIHYRTTVLRPKIMEDVKTARAFGDLSENYEYKAAKQEQRRCDSRLRYLKRMVATAKVISTDSPADVAGLFDTVTIRTKRRFRTEDLLSLVSRMEQSAKGSILRAKGIVQGTGGYLNFQYLPGDVQITNSAVGGNMLCFIGRHLNRQELTALFGAE